MKFTLAILPLVFFTDTLLAVEMRQSDAPVSIVSSYTTFVVSLNLMEAAVQKFPDKENASLVAKSVAGHGLKMALAKAVDILVGDKPEILPSFTAPFFKTRVVEDCFVKAFGSAGAALASFKGRTIPCNEPSRFFEDPVKYEEELAKSVQLMMIKAAANAAWTHFTTNKSFEDLMRDSLRQVLPPIEKSRVKNALLELLKPEQREISCVHPQIMTYYRRMAFRIIIKSGMLEDPDIKRAMGEFLNASGQALSEEFMKEQA